MVVCLRGKTVLKKIKWEFENLILTGYCNFVTVRNENISTAFQYIFNQNQSEAYEGEVELHMFKWSAPRDNDRD